MSQGQQGGRHKRTSLPFLLAYQDAEERVDLATLGRIKPGPVKAREPTMHAASATPVVNTQDFTIVPCVSGSIGRGGGFGKARHVGSSRETQVAFRWGGVGDDIEDIMNV